MYRMNVNFANPVGPYDILWNKCAGKYCHVEISLKMDTSLFRVLVDTSMDTAYDPAMLQDILSRTKGTTLKTLHLCFYIMWGGVVSLRFLDELSNDALMRPPEPPVYDTIHIPLTEEETHRVVKYNLQHLGRSYDIPRALFLLTAFTLRLNGEPDKFFCSQLVMYTLRDAGLHADAIKQVENINHMTPTDVFDWLSVQHETEESESKTDDSKTDTSTSKTDTSASKTDASKTDASKTVEVPLEKSDESPDKNGNDKQTEPVSV
jgi:hypothetical protein